VANPFSEGIFDVVVTALRGITIGSGDNLTVKRVRRFDRNTADEGYRPTIEILRQAEVKTRDSNEWFTTLTIRLLCRAERKVSSLTTDEEDNLLAFEVENAIANIDLDTLGVQLQRLENVSTAVEDADEPIDGVIVDATFEYHLRYTDLSFLTGPGRGS
jgi:hypothetical protein